MVLDWGNVLTGRAALLGLRRAGTASANGSARLLRSTDGWLAVNLPRADDVAAVPALLAPAGMDASEIDSDDPWPAVTEGAVRLPRRQLLLQAALLGIPAAALRPPPASVEPFRVERRWSPRSPIALDKVRVVDLSSMWAAPLATRILAAAGAEVVKVELSGRPDGARGQPDLYRWLHEDHQQQCTIDASSGAGLVRLRTLLASADVVVESSRPRALSQLGAGPEDIPPSRGRVWLAVSGHGRGAGARLVGFGDDAAVAGGLVGWEGPDRPVFLADAIADPVTGMVAATAVLEALRSGGGLLLDVALSSAAAWLAAGGRWGAPPASPAVRPDPDGRWELQADGLAAPIAAPVAAPPIPPPGRPSS